MIKYSSNKLTAAFLMLLLTVLMASCKHEPVIPESPAISFKIDIQPIITGNCAMSGCHDGFGGDDRFPLLTYNDVMNNGDVKPFDAQDSKLYEVITGNEDEPMPPTGPLENLQIKLIYVWIMQGAKNN